MSSIACVAGEISLAGALAAERLDSSPILLAACGFLKARLHRRFLS